MIYSKNIEVRKQIMAMVILRILSPSSKLENVRLIKENRALKDGFQYITAMTHKGIKSLIADANTPFQMGLFDRKNLVEIEYEGKRYILCKNPEKEKEDLKAFETLLEKTKNKLEEIKKSIENNRLKKAEKIMKSLKLELRLKNSIKH